MKKKTKRKKKMKYIEPGLTPQGIAAFENAIREAITVSRDTLQAKSDPGTRSDRVYFTGAAPEDIVSRSDNGTAYLVSTNPLTVNLGGDVVEVDPNWIVLENEDLSNIIRRSLDIFSGNIQLNEFINNLPRPKVVSPLLAYEKGKYSNPGDAYNVLKDTNKSLEKNRSIDYKTLKQFLNVVYKGGDHQVSTKAMIKYLKSKGISINDRRQKRINDMEKI